MNTRCQNLWAGLASKFHAFCSRFRYLNGYHRGRLGFHVATDSIKNTFKAISLPPMFRND